MDETPKIDSWEEWKRLLFGGSPPDTMIMAHAEGTWLLRRGQEPKLLGEESDFDQIWRDTLLRH